MPKPPRFQTETAQQLAVGAVTLLALAVALSLAQVFTLNHRVDFGAKLAEQSVDSLQLLLPTTWDRRDISAPEAGFSGITTEMIDPLIQGRRLIVGRAEAATPGSPDVVLRNMLNGLSHRRSRVFNDQEQIRRFRSGAFTGAYYHARSQSSAQSMVFSDRVVVLTENGRRHWLIAITMPMIPTPEANEAQEALLMKIAMSAIDNASRPATAAEIASAKLNNFFEQSANFRVTSSIRLDEPLHLSLTDAAQPGLGFVRVRSMLDPQSSDPKSGLSPALNLARVYAEIHNREPEEAQVISEVIHGEPAARVQISDGTGDSLVHELLYVRVAGSQAGAPPNGLLFDLIAEPDSADATRAMVIAAMAKAPTSTAGTGADFSSATTRGIELASAQRRQLTQLFAADLSAHIIRRDSHTLGTQMQEMYHRPAAALPLQGQRVRALFNGNGNDSLVTWAGWSASLDGLTIENTLFTELKQGPIDRTYAYRLVLRDKMLRLSTNSARDGREPLWSHPMPDGFLPEFAEQQWDLPALATATAQGPVLVWRCLGVQKPTPCWIDRIDLSKKSATEKIATPERAVIAVTIRPIMNMDPQRLFIDRDGRVIAAQWTEAASLPAGGTHLSLLPTDLKTILTLFPRNRDILRLWQRESNNHE